ncbi:MAG: photosystem I assembly protein Ycf4 [Cyanobacteria bacterium P01_H01_bin.121]
MTSASKTPTSDSAQLLKLDVLGSRRVSNYFWATVVLGGGLGFFLSSLSSYLQVNLLPFADPTQLIFIPQGIAMGFYGIAAILLSTYLWLAIFWDLGGGYNEFNRTENRATILRRGFPGKNRCVKFDYPLEDIQAVRIEIKEGLNPKRALYLKVRAKGAIPLTRVGQPLPLDQLESQGAELARFLGVPLEGL